MPTTFIDPTAQAVSSELSEGVKLFRNVYVRDCHIGKKVTIGDDTNVERSTIGNSVAINRRSYVNDSLIGDFSYSGINTTINFASIGRFCSIARNVDIGGFNHDYRKFTTMPHYRFMQLISGEAPVITKHDELCEIGNDVWIAAGAQILHKVKVGDGAIVGGGAVVTKDVPPYAIVAGVPARIIKFRYDSDIISELLAIRWWDWSQEKLSANARFLIEQDVDKNTIKHLKDIAQS